MTAVKMRAQPMILVNDIRSPSKRAPKIAAKTDSKQRISEMPNVIKLI